MAQTRQYGDIADLDDAPDIYETPELTDDTSTIPASTTVRSPSSNSSYDDAEEDSTGIDRRRVRAEEARSRFEPTRVSARGVDFSDNLVRTQKEYLVSSRRRRYAADAEHLGDFSDEEGEESVEHRLARLRQEIEEVKAELQAKESTPTQRSEIGEPKIDGTSAAQADVQKLSDLLDSIYRSERGGANGAEAQYLATQKRFSTRTKSTSVTEITLQADQRLTSPSYLGISVEQRTQILSKAAEVDQRLTALETSLGLDGNTLPDVSSDSHKPIMHLLNNLDRQLATLSSSASSDLLDTASHRVRQLTQEADRLAQRRPAATPGSSLAASGDSKANNSGSPSEPNGNSKINALFGTLPTIESLSSSLPMVLERLRTLRLIHASAGEASSTLDDLEKRQTEQAAEIEQWQEALKKVETSLSDGEGVLTSNVKLVGEWVKELEARVGKLQ